MPRRRPRPPSFGTPLFLHSSRRFSLSRFLDEPAERFSADEQLTYGHLVKVQAVSFDQAEDLSLRYGAGKRGQLERNRLRLGPTGGTPHDGAVHARAQDGETVRLDRDSGRSFCQVIIPFAQECRDP